MDERTIDLQIEAYIRKELIKSLTSLLEQRIKKKREAPRRPVFMSFVGFYPLSSFASAPDRILLSESPRPDRRLLSIEDVDDINFSDWTVESETFSEMLLRLIEESGEKNSAIYTRANIDRRHFSKIANNPNYQPSKQTVLAFAIALKLGFDKTKDLLATAGFILTKSSIADLIVSFFIEHKKYDVNLVNQILYKHGQALLGG